MQREALESKDADKGCGEQGCSHRLWKVRMQTEVVENKDADRGCGE